MNCAPGKPLPPPASWAMHQGVLPAAAALVDQSSTCAQVEPALGPS